MDRCKVKQQGNSVVAAYARSALLPSKSTRPLKKRSLRQRSQDRLDKLSASAMQSRQSLGDGRVVKCPRISDNDESPNRKFCLLNSQLVLCVYTLYACYIAHVLQLHVTMINLMFVLYRLLLHTKTIRKEVHACTIQKENWAIFGM